MGELFDKALQILENAIKQFDDNQELIINIISYVIKKNNKEKRKALKFFT